jgi:hypothetical protein
MELIREVGAFAGLAAFFGLAVLALLYFSQARDVRRLRENAEFLVEGEAPAPEREAAEPVPAAVAAEEPTEAARVAAATAPTDAEAFRRAELARQAAERRQRFEQRRRGDGRGPGGIFGAEVPSTAVMVVGAVILLAGIGFGATRLLGGDDGAGGGGDGGGGKFACPPSQTQVAVLNGTAEAGLAAGTASDLKQQGYKVTPITNTESAFDSSTVMFDQEGQDCASEVASVVGVPESEQMSQEIRGISEGAVVAVVLGDDRATGASTDASAEDGASTDSLVE